MSNYNQTNLRNTILQTTVYELTASYLLIHT